MSEEDGNRIGWREPPSQEAGGNASASPKGAFWSKACLYDLPQAEMTLVPGGRLEHNLGGS